MKKVFLFLIGLMLAGVGCVFQKSNLSEELSEVPNFQIINEIDNNETTNEMVVDEIVIEESDSVFGDVQVSDLELPIATFEIIAGDYFFKPENLMVSAGQEVTITFTENIGTHTFVIDELGLKTSVSAGKVITFIAPELPGRYYYYCDIGPHRQLGMEGVMVVE